MAKKLVGRIGREVLASPVTGKGGKGLPVSRPSEKFKRGKDTLERHLRVEIEAIKPIDLYKLLRYYRHYWTGGYWQRQYPKWVQYIDRSPYLGLIKVTEDTIDHKSC